MSVCGDLSAVQRILVVKLDEIGDFVLATPFLRGLRSSAPKATIVLAVAPVVAEMAAACPHVDAVVAAVHNRATDAIDLTPPTPAHAAHLDRLRYAMSEGGFDLAVVPRFDFDRYQGGRLGKLSGAARVVGFSEVVTPLKASRNNGFDSQFYTNVLVRSASAHEVEQNLALLAHIGGSPSDDFVEAYATPEATVSAAGIMTQVAKALHVERLIAVAPGSSYAAKEYPLTQLAPVVKAAADRLQAGIVVLGSQHQSLMGETLQSLLPGRCLNLCGRLSLIEAVEVIRAATGLISMCSAPGHIAAAVGTPVVVLSCHPRDGDPEHFHAPERFRPWATDRMALVIQPESTVGDCHGFCLALTSHCISAIDAGKAAIQVADFFET